MYVSKVIIIERNTQITKKIRKLRDIENRHFLFSWYVICPLVAKLRTLRYRKKCWLCHNPPTYIKRSTLYKKPQEATTRKDPTLGSTKIQHLLHSLTYLTTQAWISRCQGTSLLKLGGGVHWSPGSSLVNLRDPSLVPYHPGSSDRSCGANTNPEGWRSILRPVSVRIQLAIVPFGDSRHLTCWPTRIINKKLDHLNGWVAVR